MQPRCPPIDPPAAARDGAALAVHQAVSDRCRENDNVQVRRHAALFADVIAGGERPAAGAGHHQHAHLGIGRGHRRDDLVDQRLARGVVPFRPVQRDGGDAVVHFVKQELVAHVSVCMVRARGRG